MHEALGMSECSNLHLLFAPPALPPDGATGYAQRPAAMSRFWM
ncbi:MAG: hypothetical protein R3D46_16075 [Defluviimonas denitrificans]